jgi:alpha-galactosidase
MSNRLLLLFLSGFIFISASGYTRVRNHKELDGCKAILINNVLTLENERLIRTYNWNNGDLISTKITDKKTGYT